MIEFDKFCLENGLRVIVHRDESTPIVAVNILYDVGARDEDPDRTGFAHLFEHLMFGGSVNIPKYDEPVEKCGGSNNAFTTNDITNYYLTIPLDNLETAFWLESDRMEGLAFSEKSLKVQQNVVIEEYKQRYLNQPYGDAWPLLRPMAYKVHPYRWPTIGKNTDHIENASLKDVKEFFYRYYGPDNAILSVAGNVDKDEVLRLSEKWFGSIESRNTPNRNLPEEPVQEEKREQDVDRNVPFDAIYMCYHICARKDEAYHVVDLISDILSNGKSSRLYQQLVKKRKLFSEIDAYLTGDLDPGLFVVSGKLSKGVTMQEAEASVHEQLNILKFEMVNDEELSKVKNKFESFVAFAEMNVMTKATNLAIFELLGDAKLINSELDRYSKVTKEQVRTQAREVFSEENLSVLRYFSASK